VADSVNRESPEETAEQPRSQVTFETRLRWYESYVLDKSEEIRRSKRDRRYYDGIQWTADEIKQFKARNQPVVTYNRIQPKTNFILGHEVRTRVNPNAQPRTPHHEDSKGAITDSLRYVGDDVNFDSTRWFCTEDQLIQGCTGVVVGIEENAIITKRVRWRNFFHDPKSVDPDFGDAKYLGVANWWDLDDAISDPQYKHAQDILEDASSRSGDESDQNRDAKGIWSDPDRRRLLIVEMYWKEGGEWWVCHTTFAGDIIEPQMVVYVDEDGKTFCPLIATSCFVIQEDEDDEGPSGPIGERYGVVRGWISPQDEINHRRSRALHDSNVYGAIYEENAVDNIHGFLTQMAKPGGMAKVRDGALAESRIQLRQPGELSQVHLALLQEAKQEIDATGPSLPVTAGDSSVMSGRAIIAKQSIGSMELERPFDNIRQWQRRVYTAWWHLIRHPELGWKEEMWLRVRDSKMKEGYRFVTVNRVMTRAQRIQELMQKDVPFETAIGSVGLAAGEAEAIMMQAQQVAQQQIQQQVQVAQLQIQQQVGAMGGQVPPEAQQQIQQQAQQVQQQIQQQMPQMIQQLVMSAPQLQEQYKEHDISQLCMDIIIEETPDTTIAAQEEFSELMDLGQRSPGLIGNPAFMKALIRNSSLRSKNELIDALEQDPDPMQQQAAQMQMQQMQLGMQQMQAQIAKLQADAQLTATKVQSEQASAARDMAQAQIAIPAEAQRDQADAMNKAASAGSQTVAEPQPPIPGGV